MGRMLKVWLLIGLMTIGFGCQHMAGVCDCDAGPYTHVVPGMVVNGTTARTTEPPRAADSGSVQAASVRTDR